MRFGFRTRLALTMIGLVAATAIVVGVIVSVATARTLRDDLLAEAVERTQFAVGVLADARLDADPTLEEFQTSPLLADLRLGADDGLFVAFPDGTTFSSGFAFAAGPSDELAAAVTDGTLAHRWTTLDAGPYLVTGGRLPGRATDFFFYFSAAGVDRALGLVRTVSVVIGLVLVALGVVAARAAARAVLRPVGRAAGAASEMAEGDLSVRLPVESQDELGDLAGSFNRMAINLERSIADLRDSEARQRRFVADVAHELRTPITALGNAAGLLEDHLDEGSPEQRRVAELLAADVRRLRRLVDDLLEISRLEAGGVEVTAEPVDLGGLAAAVAARFEGTSVDGGTGVTAVSDRRRLERILVNLVENAVVHGGGAAEIEIEAAGGEIRLAVADRGPGVDPALLPRIFERFYQVDPSRSAAGSGLGLAIAEHHARALGARLVAENRRAGGLRVELVLPRSAGFDGSGAAAEPAPTEQTVSGLRSEEPASP